MPNDNQNIENINIDLPPFVFDYANKVIKTIPVSGVLPYGFVVPNMTTAQRNAMGSRPAGTIIYNTTTNKMNFWNGSAWEVITSAA